MQALIDFGLMPQDEAERKTLERCDPYQFRTRALDEQLEPYDLGRALFHLNQRRGFKSNRKVDSDETEGKKLSERISDMRRSIDESGARTLGEFMAGRHKSRQTVRARPELGLYPDRAMYLDEFDKIRKKQEPLQGLVPEQWDKLRDIIFFQRDLKPVEPGWCQYEYENGERRAAKALPVFQEFRMLQEVNNLKIRVGSEPERPLNEQERGRALKRLRSGSDIDLQKPTKDVGLPSGASLNLARGGRKKVKGDETTAKLASSGKPAKGDKPDKPGLFGNRWHNLFLEERNDIVKFLLDTEDPEAVRQKAMDKYGLNQAQATAVANVSLVPGYENLSEKAINKIAPHMVNGEGYDAAVKKAGYDHFRNDEAHDSLPYYGAVLPRDAVGADPTKDPEKDGDVAHYGRFPNPTVHIGLNQLRRVVNKLIKAYGKPEEIVVELTRGLKHREDCQRPKPKAPRPRCGRCVECLQIERVQNEKRNARFRVDLKAEGVIPTHDVLRKLRLWEEQKNSANVLVCPYTGQTLSFEMVVGNRTEIDHILPFSKTLDNSPSNMVVCIAAVNRFKGDLPPIEAFGQSPQGYDYQEILARTANFPENKLWRFLSDAMERFKDEDKFLDRQLNETSYLSRTAKTYLAHLYDEKGEGRNRVRAAPGRMTALLRRGWGLEGILRETEEDKTKGKQRDDHRHHAIDAFVVACTTQGLLQKFAHAAGASHNTGEKLDSVAKKAHPWTDFHRNQLKPFLDRLIVSYKPDHGTRGIKEKPTGQLHKETAYGLVKPLGNDRFEVVTRKKVADFKKQSDLDAIRDPAMRKALKDLWIEVEAEGLKPADFAERAAMKGVRLEDGRLQTVRRVRITDQQTIIPIKRGREHPEAGKLYKGYIPGYNEFADIWLMRDGTWQMVVVRAFCANQPDFNPEDFRPKDKSGRKDPTAKKLMRLQINDMGALGERPSHHIVRIRKITNAASGVFVILDDHNESNVAARVGKGLKENRYSAKQLLEQNFRKVRVDEVGRIWDPGPRKR